MLMGFASVRACGCKNHYLGINKDDFKQMHWPPVPSCPISGRGVLTILRQENNFGNIRMGTVNVGTVVERVGRWSRHWPVY